MMMTKLKQQMKDERGIAAFIAMALVILLTGVGILAIRNSNDEITLAGNERDQTKAFYAAEAGLEQATAAIQTNSKLRMRHRWSCPQGRFRCRTLMWFTLPVTMARLLHER